MAQLYSDKAPTSHASTATTYGRGNASSYGHVKVSDNYTSSAGAASAGVAASSKALYDAYSSLKQGKVDTAHGAHSTYTHVNLEFVTANGYIAGFFINESSLTFFTAKLDTATSTFSSCVFRALYGNLVSKISVVKNSSNNYRIKFDLNSPPTAFDIVLFVDNVDSITVRESAT